MAKKHKSDPYSTQAQNITTSRYGPEVSALAALLRQAQEDRDTSLRQAKSGRQFTVGAVDQARPAINRAFQGAQAAVAPAFAQGGGIEATALNARMGEAQALAQYQLQGRRVSAVEGEQAARVQANRDFTSDREKIGQRATDLARESGAFTASTITDLIGQDAAAQADANKTAASLGQSGAQQPALRGHRPGHGPADPRRQARPEGAPQATPRARGPARSSTRPPATRSPGSSTRRRLQVHGRQSRRRRRPPPQRRGRREQADLQDGAGQEERQGRRHQAGPRPEPGRHPEDPHHPRRREGQEPVAARRRARHGLRRAPVPQDAEAPPRPEAADRPARRPHHVRGVAQDARGSGVAASASQQHPAVDAPTSVPGLGDAAYTLPVNRRHRQASSRDQQPG
jgi:hypothetical protein